MNDSGTSEGQSWERAWSTDEIRKNSANWTLAGDAGLLNGLKGLSQTLLTRAEHVKKDVDSLAQDYAATNSRINNAITDFLMLSNMQFVENRVYDEEIQEDLINSEKKVQVEPKSKEQREADIVPKITEAVKCGLYVVENAFEKHEVVDSESEEEEESNSFVALPVLKPKDTYLHRPLPYIIGTEKFMQDDYVGLGDMISDEDEAEESDKDDFEDVVGESKNITCESVENTDSESDIRGTSRKSFQQNQPHISKEIHATTKYDSEDEGDLFVPEQIDDAFSSDEDVNSNIGDNQNFATSANFAAELAAKLGVTQQRSTSSDKEESSEADETSSEKIIKRRNSKAKKSSRTNVEKKPSLRSAKKHDSSIGSLDANSDEEENSPFRKSTLFSGGGGLFDDLNEEENDLFSEITKTNKKEIPQKANSSFRKEKTSDSSSSKSFLNSDNESDLFSKMAGNKGDSPVSQPVRKTSLFDDADGDDDDDLFSSVINKPSGKTRESKTSLTLDNKKNEDLFTPTKTENHSSESTPKIKLPAGAVSMFGPGTNLMTEALKKHQTHSDSDKEDVEDADSSDKGQQWETRSTTSTLSSGFGKIDTPKDGRLFGGGNLFTDDSEESNLFSSIEKVNPNNPDKKISLFDDENNEEDDDYDLFSIKKQSVVKPAEIKPEEKLKTDKPIKTSASTSQNAEPLFDNNDQTDLFQIKTEIKSKPTEKIRTRSLFDDDDALFGGPSEESPSVDLFKSTNTKTDNTVFDATEDDEDLFASSSDSKSAAKPPIPTPRKVSLPKEEINVNNKSSSADSDTSASSPATSSTGSPKKKPPGGISLFQGIDPFAGKMKGLNYKENTSPTNKESKVKSKDAANRVDEPTDIPSVSLNLKKIHPTEERAVSFEQPAEANTLQVTSKNRARIQFKRRLPSRKARIANKKEDVFGDAVEPEVKEAKEDDLFNGMDEKDSPVTNNPLSPSTEEEDLLSVDEFVSSKVTPTIASHNGNKTKERKSTLEQKDANDSKVKETNKAKIDLFVGLNSKKDDDIFATTNKKTTSKSMLTAQVKDDDDDDDDLFSSASKHTQKYTHKAKDDDLNELFAPSKGKSAKKMVSLFNDGDSDSEDIFSDLKSEPAKSEKTEKVQNKVLTQKTVTKKTKGLFDDDDDDISIFEDPLMVKQQNAK